MGSRWSGNWNGSGSGDDSTKWIVDLRVKEQDRVAAIHKRHSIQIQLVRVNGLYLSSDIGWKNLTVEKRQVETQPVGTHMPEITTRPRPGKD